MCSQIITIGIGIVFIFGGLSGELVLRGTSSGPLLALVGLIMVIYGLWRIASISRRVRAAAPAVSGNASPQPQPDTPVTPVTINSTEIPSAPVAPSLDANGLPDPSELSGDQKTRLLFNVLQIRRQEVRRDSNSVTVENMDRYLKKFPITEAELLGMQQTMDVHKEKLIADQAEPEKIAQLEQLCGLLQDFRRLRFPWSVGPTPR